MVSPRALNLTCRWRCSTSVFARYAFRTTAARPKSTGNNYNPDLIYLTAFERAMQDVYGVQWKKCLNSKQWGYVRDKEDRRRYSAKKLEQEAEAAGGVRPERRPARDDEYDAKWHAKVERFRVVLSQKKQARESKGKDSS
ncbi:hypothetical protein LA080_005142 [Diaporthe eres]|uniref:Uncharacterized protein n=1 Tax=Diaporthe vaccinii TaxID=105482 RepID=A0ABR4EQ00_9PEZI|nr:hypothetical protein LA080_005142 [Diaporthe eres]